MPASLKSQLTPDEQLKLVECETVIANGMLTFVETGNALLAVSDQRLYRATHSTFKDYVQEKWNMSVSRAYQLCEAAEIVRSCPPLVESPLNERQVRELGKVPEDKREEVLAKATRKGKVTANTIKEAAKPEQPEKLPTLDDVLPVDAAWKSAAGDPEVWKPKTDQQIILTALQSNWTRADAETRALFTTFQQTN